MLPLVCKNGFRPFGAGSRFFVKICGPSSYLRVSAGAGTFAPVTSPRSAPSLAHFQLIVMRTRFYSFLLALLTTGFAAYAQPARFDTTGGRYYQPIFPQVTVTTGVAFGTAVNVIGQNQTLLLDFYEPTGDALAQRPLIVFAHEGGFVGGTRNDAYSVAFARRMARLGYCVASIDYRLLFFPLNDTVALGGAGFRAMQDMRGAIRFLRAGAAGANTFRIASDFIVAAGSSAGAVTALNVAYFDQPSEVPAFLAPLNLGTLEGISGPAGFSSAVQAAIGLCGGLNRASWLAPGDEPMCVVHGTADGVVPYGRGTAGGGLPPLRVYGSGVIAPTATALGITTTLRTFRNAGHVPYNTLPRYADSTFWTVRDFLRPLVASAPPLGVAAPVAADARAAAWPVPAPDAVRLRWTTGRPFQPLDAELVDAATGRLVRRFRWETAEQLVPRAGLAPGVYVVRVGSAAVRVVFE